MGPSSVDTSAMGDTIHLLLLFAGVPVLFAVLMLIGSAALDLWRRLTWRTTTGLVDRVTPVPVSNGFRWDIAYHYQDASQTTRTGHYAYRGQSVPADGAAVPVRVSRLFTGRSHVEQLRRPTWAIVLGIALLPLLYLALHAALG